MRIPISGTILKEPPAGPFMERLDSENTDDSPFASSLTTPVDEDVELFSGIKARLLGKDTIGIGRNTGPQPGFLDYQELDRSLFDRKKSPLLDVDDIEPGITPSPTVTEIYRKVLKEQTEREDHPTGKLEQRRFRRPTNDLVRCDLAPEEPDKYASCFEPEIGELYDMHSDEDGEEFHCLLNVGAEKPDVTANSDLELFSELPFALANSGTGEGHAMDSDVFVPTLQLPSFQTFLPVFLRAAFFLPWCVLVGGTILLSPQHLDLIAFRPGYIQPPPAPGTGRFKHWAETGREFVGIFLGFVASVWWKFPWFGLLVVTGVLCLSFYAWGDFTLDEKRGVKLGKNDKESLWIVLKGYGLQVREGRGGWFVGACLENPCEDDDNDDDGIM